MDVKKNPDMSNHSRLHRLEAESIHILREGESLRLRCDLTSHRAATNARSRSEGQGFLVRPGWPSLEVLGICQ